MQQIVLLQYQLYGGYYETTIWASWLRSAGITVNQMNTKYRDENRLKTFGDTAENSLGHYMYHNKAKK